jgi:hypothetical protein
VPNYATFSSGYVTNVIVADSAEIAEELTGGQVMETTGAPWTGWRLEEGKWVAPPTPEPVEPPVEEQVVDELLIELLETS